jgi:hypothetical protein
MLAITKSFDGICLSAPLNEPKSSQSIAEDVNNILSTVSSVEEELTSTLAEKSTACLGQDQKAERKLNCEIWDPLEISNGDFLKALSLTEEPINSAQSDWTWVRSLSLFNGLKKDEITIQEHDSAGGGINSGIHLVFIRSKPRYILKTTECEDVKNAWKISQTILSHPKSILKAHQDGNPNLKTINIESLEDIPRIAVVLAVHKRGNTCQELMELAPGDEGTQFIGLGDLDLSKDIGRKIAFLHRMGFSHGDLHPRNYFYDKVNHTLTLIDYETMKFGKPEPKWNDLELLGSADADKISDMISNALTTIREESSSSVAFKRAILQSPRNTEVLKPLIKANSKLAERRSLLEGYVHQFPPKERKSLIVSLNEIFRKAISKITVTLKTQFNWNEREVIEFYSLYPELFRLTQGLQ